jgi:hypothetical protein
MKRLLTPIYRMTMENIIFRRYYDEKKRLNEHTGHVDGNGCPQMRKYICYMHNCLEMGR